ncbi:MAG: hypothetical protein SCALA702_37310 [Melioribacteraceae bacterium]|nr:MAG: hypothetical protein SCALA702_37310 [Melioribacteraceae bacterium]
MLETVKSLKNLLSAATHSERNVFNEICEFLIGQQNLYAVAFFLHENGKLLLQGKSSNVDPNIRINSVVKTNMDGFGDSSEDFSISYNPGCGTVLCENEDDFTRYCIKFRSDKNSDIIIKVVQSRPFSEDQHNYYWEFSQLINKLLTIGKAKDVQVAPASRPVAGVDEESRTLVKELINSVKNISKESKIKTDSSRFIKLKEITDKLESLMFSDNEYQAIKNGTVQVNKEKIVLINFAPEIKSELGSMGIRFNIQYRNQLPESISADKSMLEYAIINLSKFLHVLNPAGDITLFLGLEADQKIKFNIRNENNGISSSIKELLKPNFQNNIPELANADISGYSLIVINHYSKMMGGSFKINKLSSNSLAFEFSIDGEFTDKITSTITQLPKPDKNNNKILVIEDDFSTSRMMEKYLEEWGYSPAVVNTPKQAFEKIKNDAFLAVILNIEIPNYNGLELLKELKELPEMKGTPVIVFSVEAEEQKAYMFGAVEYFVKPINYNYLVEVLTNYKLKRDSIVLCVDDDEPALNLVSNAIEQAGFNSLAFSESWKVMDNIRGKNIDLAIIDLDMPQVNGFELIKKIKSEDEFANLPIIIYTGKENYEEDLHQIDGMFESLFPKQSTNFESLRNNITAMISRYDTPPPVEEVIKKKDVVKILLAEDYKHSQIIVTRLLKKNNFTNIVVVENGQMAVDMAKKEDFALILMDMQMPIMNGFDATRTIRTLPGYHDTPVIALTAFAMKGDREKCLEAGATDYIPKPIDSKEFIEKVKHYTRQS